MKTSSRGTTAEDAGRTPCYGKSVLFDSINIGDHLRAKSICESCPVIESCCDRLEETVRLGGIYGRPEGTWAGQLHDGSPRPWRRSAATERAIARRAFEDRAFDQAEARKAHAAYASGDRSDWARMGHRVYDRRRKTRTEGAA